MLNDGANFLFLIANVVQDLRFKVEPKCCEGVEERKASGSIFVFTLLKLSSKEAPTQFRIERIVIVATAPKLVSERGTDGEKSIAKV